MLNSYRSIIDICGYLYITLYLAVMLQDTWDTQRVTKSQKVNRSSHDGLQNFTTLTFLNIGPRVSMSVNRVGRIPSSFTKY